MASRGLTWRHIKGCSTPWEAATFGTGLVEAGLAAAAVEEEEEEGPLLLLLLLLLCRMVQWQVMILLLTISERRESVGIGGWQIVKGLGFFFSFMFCLCLCVVLMV